MFHRNAVLAAAGLALAVGTGCSGSTDFDITKTFDPVNSTPPAVYSYTQHVDMAAEAGTAWKHRSKIKSLELLELTGTMTTHHSGPATTGSGSVVLSRNGTNATVGTWTNEPIPVTPPHTISTTLDKSSVSLIEDALKNDGLFDVMFVGSTADAVSFGADVTLHLKLKYKVP